MDGETMQKSFDDILNGKHGHNKDFEITPEEATKFKAAMADPEFQAMLRDYMEEMQDPAQRAEQELYISELEGQNRIPEGKEVVHPVPGFVIKTKFIRDAKDAQPEKLFANVVTSDKLAKPFSKASRTRAGGESWSLPVAVGPLRMEKDKGGGSTTTFDVCYHPEALVRAQKLDAFRDLVALSSLERVEDAFLRGTNQKMTVDKNYRILKGVKYKSGPCATMMVAKADINRVTGSKRTTPVPETKTRSATANARGNAPKETAEPATAARGAGARAGGAKGKGEGDDGKQTLAQGLKRGNGGTTYKLVESGSFEIADHTSDRVRQTPTPQTLIATVTLPPDAEPTRKLDVLVAVRRLTIGVLGDPEGSSPRYLDITLPYDVEDDSKCSAARDKAGLLKITMPVKPPPAPPAPAGSPSASSPAAEAEVGDGGGVGEHQENLSGEVKSDTTDPQAEQKSAPPSTTSTRQPDHSRWINEAPPQGTVLDKPWEESRGAIGHLPPPPPETEATARGAVDLGEKDLEEQLAKDKDRDYVPCERFIKKIDGYEFKTGMKGCGYYRDDKNKKVPDIDWNETVKTVCGVVEVPDVIDSSVHLAVTGRTMVLSFDAVAPPGRAGAGLGAAGGVERYRTEMNLPGDVAAGRCSHDTAAENLVVKLPKEPEREWGSTPTPTRSTDVSSRIDKIIEAAAAVTAAEAEEAGVAGAAAAVTENAKEGDRSAPGYEGSVPTPPPRTLLNTLAEELD